MPNRNRIEHRIVDVEAVNNAAPPPNHPTHETPVSPNEIVHEKLERPAALPGMTYKIKTPLSEHALYVTINNIVLNKGTDGEHMRPFEMFINSKNMEHFQWIVALTRIISAVFRKGGDIAFMIEELRSIFDPNGSYFQKGGKFIPSVVNEIGDILETHLLSIGMLLARLPNPAQEKVIDDNQGPIAHASQQTPDD